MSTTHKNNSEKYSIYGGDIRETPAYNILQASRYLRIPFETLRSWVRGRTYTVGGGDERREFKPVIKLLDRDRPALSFMNLIEAHVLDGIRRQHSVPFYKVRNGLAFLEEEIPSKHPLADWLFQTDGVDLFVEYLDKLINISQHGQLVMRDVMEGYLRRIERDFKGAPARLYPFIEKPESVEQIKEREEPRKIVIDPLVSFGRPVLTGTGIPTDILAERFYAGDSTDLLARDYGLTRSQIEEAVRYEAPTSKAA